MKERMGHGVKDMLGKPHVACEEATNPERT